MNDQSSVTAMFDGIAPRYDFLNRLLSLHIDTLWRRKASRAVSRLHPATILDVATGTADLAIDLAVDNPLAKVKGIDLSERMLELGRGKVSQRKLGQRIKLISGDAAALPFDDGSFDAVTVGFGVRNFADLDKGLSEMARVTKEGGAVMILEFSHPTNPLVKAAYRLYSKFIPFVGKCVSKHPTAYRYLPASIDAFPSSRAFMEIMHRCGIDDIQAKPFSGGIVTLYLGKVQKNAPSLQ